MPLHDVESGDSATVAFGQFCGVLVELSREDPKSNDGDIGLVAVLLEVHPLKNLRTLVAIVGPEIRPLREEIEDRIALREGPSVVQHEERDSTIRIECEKLGRSSLPFRMSNSIRSWAKPR